MNPFYQTSDGMVTIYNAKWEDVFASGSVDMKQVKLIHADPQYGIAYNTKALHERNHSEAAIRNATKRRGTKHWGTEWKPINGDDEPFDPEPLIALKKPMILWGANNFANRLPPCPGWIVWEKKRAGTVAAKMKVSAAELAWCNFGKMVQCFHHMWIGFARDTEVHRHLHPTQKPEALCAFSFAHAIRYKKIKRGDTILAPYGGSAPEIGPALAIGCKVVVCEVDQEYCETAIRERIHGAQK